MLGSRRGQGIRTPSEKSQKYRVFLSSTGLDPLKNYKAYKSAFNVEPSSAPFKRRSPGGPMIANLCWYWVPPSPHQLKKEKENVDKVRPPLLKFARSSHGFNICFGFVLVVNNICFG